eukprot:TRINITY_DN7202_c0_g1_i1.p1 TRINITY_DN7202_c0_g1~~TRINITY_DN7202_c0_g1_i1.p1  ORF type:complete len:114 (+),score=18.78 TRINITY_DN7202_c0_g1_i1:284-625(+)
MSKSLVSNLENSIKRDICPGIMVPSMLLWGGMLLSGIASLFIAFTSRRAMKVFVEDVYSKLEDFDLLVKDDVHLNVVDDSSLDNWNAMRVAQKSSEVASLVQFVGLYVFSSLP